MSLGKAAVFKHIPVYYPDRVGAVGGVVGLVGGLGGFIMPIAFGALNDLTGIWQSCFWLLFALVATALVWMHRGGPADGAHRAGGGCRDLDVARTPGDATGAWTGAARGTRGRRRHQGLAARGCGVLECDWPQDRPTQPVDLGPLPAVVVRHLDGVVGRGGKVARGWVRVHQRATVLARGTSRGCPERHCAWSTPSCRRCSAAACGRR